ncbi:MAG: hypothetical protein ABR601_06370 [Parasphingopyxis sp.]|nr:hypothetical protein [Sphingomonadales bacterium]
MRLFALLPVVCGAAFAIAPLAAQPTEDPQYSFADLADAALGAPVVALAEIDDAIRLRDERAVGVPAGHVRYYVEADLLNLIRSDRTVPGRIRYLIDMPLDADGGRPDIEDRQVLLMLEPVQGRPGEMRLVSRHGQIDWTPEREQVVRGLLAEAADPAAPGAVTGIGNIFSVPGTLPGENETQIFLATADGRPVSLSVLRRPGQQPRWNVSLGEVVTQSLPPPEPETLLWYRLACSLPAQVPASALETMDAGQVERARADYALVLRDLGPCPRYLDGSR